MRIPLNGDYFEFLVIINLNILNIWKGIFYLLILILGHLQARSAMRTQK